MYRKLKNLLGISLIILAVLIAQLPMPESSAETSSNTPVTVTFSMNGGSYNGEYMGYSLDGKTPVAVLDKNELISEFPLESAASYSGYKTVADTWYTDDECLNEFDKKSKISKSITLYKRWYSVTEDGFYLNPDKTVLYKYAGSGISIEIPETVETIAANAFDKLDGVRGITLAPNIKTVQENAFSGVDKQDSIIYVYDTGSTQSELLGKRLDDEYGQLVHSAYLDMEEVEEMAGIDYMLPETSSEKSAKSAASTVNNYKTSTAAPVAKINKEDTTGTKANSEKGSETEKTTEVVKATKAANEIKEQTKETNETEKTKETAETKEIAETKTTTNATAKTSGTTEENKETGETKKETETANTTKATAPKATAPISTASSNTQNATIKKNTQSTSSTVDKNTQSASTTVEKSTQSTSTTVNKNTQSANTVEKKSTQSASAPKSSEHVLDSTPKTGDAVQYRLLIAICLFSAGALMLLTGNGKKRKSVAF